jgi:hypothetical protein
MISGLLGGSAVEMSPEKRACGGFGERLGHSAGFCALFFFPDIFFGDASALLLLSPGCHVKLAVLKPPKDVLSHMILHCGIESGVSNLAKKYGFLGMNRPCICTAIVACLLNSSIDRLQKPGRPPARRICVACIVEELDVIRMSNCSSEVMTEAESKLARLLACCEVNGYHKRAIETNNDASMIPAANIPRSMSAQRYHHGCLRLQSIRDTFRDREPTLGIAVVPGGLIQLRFMRMKLRIPTAIPTYEIIPE